MWLNQSLLPRLLDDSVLLRDTGSVLLGTLRLRQTRGEQSEMTSVFSCCFVWFGSASEEHEPNFPYFARR